MTQHWNEIGNQFSERASAVLAQAKKMHDGPLGTEPRSVQEQAALWKKITALPDPELDDYMNGLMQKSGHERGEAKPCEGCRFVLQHAPKGA